MNANADLLRELRIDRPPEMPRRRRWPWIVAAILGVLVLIAAAGMLLGQRPVEVETATAIAPGAGGNNSVLDATGYVVARRMATVSAKVPGKVREVRIEEGQTVRAGEIIATLDPIDAEHERALAQSQLQAARSQAGSLQAQLREAEANASRLAPLLRQQLVSKAQHDQAIAQRDSLRAQLNTARRNAEVAERGLRIAAQGVDNTVVRAPFDGVVIAKAAQPGEIVSPMAAGGGFTRTGIGTIVDMDSLEVEVDVGESYIGRVRPGMPVEATLNAYPDWKIPAEVIAIIPTADRSKATVKVRIKLNQKDPRIVPDMGVKVSFLDEAKPGDTGKRAGVRIPAAAVVERDGKQVVFVVGDKDVVAMTQVTVGGKMGDADVQVMAGLDSGATVVVSPPDTLQTGSRIKAKAEDGESDGDA
ncbi:MAG: efflux RND transporter periplasmic adaptor subunit [Pseudoxanthomonas suwonensis]|nr:MAG: efflux RND transporter periplasmic adaptor subunit [Pseudoxanthomonas suwonensis]